MYRKLLALALAAGLLGPAAYGADSTPAWASDPSFLAWNNQLSKAFKANPNYHSPPINTNDQVQEFANWMYELYSKKLTPQQFKEQMAKEYPGYDKEVNFIISRLPAGKSSGN
ncbi:hypothetical protein [Paraburkholderia sp. J63]|uniref:hypothetical protein n=1 Tax=Paraburkholderia sp. J63 TaxID=2805434 RepID=UPI002ABE175E|nr:hypothetical protein [Paraburkholderia sp. J63]